MSRHWLFWLGMGSGLLLTAGCQTAAEKPAEKAQTSALTLVQTVAPAPAPLQRTTTQPATVHAYFESQVYAKTAGYISNSDGLKADIGQEVDLGQVLAVLDVPELGKRREAKLSEIKRLKADEVRAQAELDVTQASVSSYRAKVEQAKADIAKAEAMLSAAKIELDRVKDLVERKSLAERMLDESIKRHEASQAEKTSYQAAVTSAEAELVLSLARQQAAVAHQAVASANTEVAQSELATLDELIKYTQILSPLKGVVTQRNVDPGNLVPNAHNGSGSALPLFVVAQLDRVRVRVAVPERDAPLVDLGDAVSIQFQALPGKQFTGEVSRTSNVLAESTRTLMVEIDLPNPNGELLPGMFGQATIVLETSPPRVSLSANVVRYDGKGRSYVYVVDSQNCIQVVDVSTGLDDGNQIEITAGLQGSERVVGPLLHRLHPGQKVRLN